MILSDFNRDIGNLPALSRWKNTPQKPMQTSRGRCHRQQNVPAVRFRSTNFHLNFLRDSWRIHGPSKYFWAWIQVHAIFLSKSRLGHGLFNFGPVRFANPGCRYRFRATQTTHLINWQLGCCESIQIGQNPLDLHQPIATRVSRSLKSNGAFVDNARDHMHSGIPHPNITVPPFYGVNKMHF